MEPLHAGLQSELMYKPENFVTVEICTDCGKLATVACHHDVRRYEDSYSRVEKVMVYPEDAPTDLCDCHVMVNFCVDCGAVANSGCTNVARRSLVKMTQAEVNELIKASKCGLSYFHNRDNYIYQVDKNCNPVPFFGLDNDVNIGLQEPYLVCDTHKGTSLTNPPISTQ